MKQSYMSRIDLLEYNLMKQNEGLIPIKMKFVLWINHLSNPINFREFNMTISTQELERNRKNQKVLTLTNLDLKIWNKFLANCKLKSLFANDVINILVKRYNSEGFCFDINIEV